MLHLDDYTDCLWVAFFLLLLVGYAAILIHFFISKKKRKEELLAEWDAEGDEGPTPEETEVRILEKHCMARVYGTRSPQSRKEFFVTFLARDGSQTTFPVEEEVYLALEEDQHGTLLTVDGNFYGFCPDEEA